MSFFTRSLGPESLPKHCQPVSHYLSILSSAFSTCVPTNLAFISTALGVCSIVSWLFAQVPQIYKNYQIKSAAGLSILFLTEWLIGDLTNFLGAILTKQATWQILLAAYYVTVDICLVFQYAWYSQIQPWRKFRIVEMYPQGGDGDFPDMGECIEGVNADSSGNSSIDSRSKATKEKEDRKSAHPAFGQHQRAEASDVQLVIEKGSPSPPEAAAFRSFKLPPLSSTRSTLLVATFATSMTLAAAFPVAPPLPIAFVSSIPPHSMVTSAISKVQRESMAEFVGRILSWISTVSYLLSRLPQIIKNARRRSTAGLSPTLFIAAFFGNLFYSISVLCNPLAWDSYPRYGCHGWVGNEGSDRATWVALAAPFWLGAAGVLGMDAIIGVQFLILGEGGKKDPVVIINVIDVDAEEEESGRDTGGNNAAGTQEQEGRGRRKWKRVTGWMRGWVPSPSPERVVRMSQDRDRERNPLLNDNGSRQDEETQERRDYGT